MPFDKERIAALIDDLFRITGELTALTGRSFAPDRHLVGSMGETIAADAYGLALTPHSEKWCDAIKDKMRIEIKATFGDRVAFRVHGADHVVHHCIVLKLRGGVDFEEVYNGPMAPLLGEISTRSAGSNG